MASAQPTASAWQPNGLPRPRRNSGTKDSVNDRQCAHCGELREHKQTTFKHPPKVWCPECWKSQGITSTNCKMRPKKEEKEKGARLRAEALARGRATQSAAAEEKVADILEDRPRAAQDEVDAEFDKLTEHIKDGRPAAGGLFWWLRCGLICGCNLAICLLAESYAPAVFMVLIYLCGCIPAKTGDVVAIPKDYIGYGVAVSTLMNERYPGRVNPWAFVGLRALEQAESCRQMPRYDQGGQRTLDSTYDRVPRRDQHRISLCAAHNEDALMPGAIYDVHRDWLGVFDNESAGQAGISIIKFPLLMKDESSGRHRKTVVAVKCKRRQFVLAHLFARVLSARSWLPAHARDFAVLKEQAKPVTIGVQISN